MKNKLPKGIVYVRPDLSPYDIDQLRSLWSKSSGKIIFARKGDLEYQRIEPRKRAGKRFKQRQV